MTIAIALCASFLVAGLCAAAQDGETPAISCNLQAIGSADRPRYHELRKCLRSSVRNRAELPNGFTFTLDGKAMLLPDVAEWMALERRCCPFLTLQLSASGHQTDWLLTLTGPQGVKALLQAEFPAQ